jgi:hypothetical protein
MFSIGSVNQLVVGSIPTAGAIFNKIKMLTAIVDVKWHGRLLNGSLPFLPYFPNPESLSL